MSNTTLKIKTEENKWEQVYGNAIANRLRKDENLADLVDKQEARQNLELTGDNNTTHYHDNRYLPLIEGEINARKAETSQLRTELDAEVSSRIQDKTDISNSLIEIQNNLENTMANTKQELSNNMNILQDNVDAKLKETNAALNQADVAAKTISVAGSTVASHSALSMKSISSGSSYSYATETINPSLGSGTYTIADLLSKLSAMSHSHSFSDCGGNCNCNCNCTHSSHSH